MKILIDLYQQSQLIKSQSKAAQALAKASHPEVEVDDLVRRTEAVALATQALWEIVRDQFGLSDDVLLRKMFEVDLRDGALDGRMSPGLTNCPSCHRGNKVTRHVCIYCGAPLPVENVFDKA